MVERWKGVVIVKKEDYYKNALNFLIVFFLFLIFESFYKLFSCLKMGLLSLIFDFNSSFFLINAQLLHVHICFNLSIFFLVIITYWLNKKNFIDEYFIINFYKIYYPYKINYYSHYSKKSFF